MRFGASNGPASLAEVCKLAWHTFYGMQKASDDFENLRFEVWTIAISLDSLHSVGNTSVLIDRQADKARWSLAFSKILTSLSSALRPLHSLVKLYLSSSSKDRASVKCWLNAETQFEGLTVQDFRRKLSMLVESLNVFLSCLTHAELARAREVTESEEYRVLSEVTKNVLQRWDQNRTTPVPRQPERDIRPVEPVGFVNDDVRSYMMPLLNSSSPSIGFQPHSPVPSPIGRTHEHHTLSSHPAGAMNLDDIESGFRSHMHAMRRIREQLRQQDVNRDHMSNHRSDHFPEVNGGHDGHLSGDHPPQTPTSPSLRRATRDSTQSSEISGDFADASSASIGSMQTSESGSVVSGYQPGGANEVPNSQFLVPRQQTSSGELRKRKRRSQYRFHAGLGGDNLHSSEGEGSDDGAIQGKTALEEILTTVLFFDN